MDSIGNAAWNFGLAVAVIGTVTALLVQALDELAWRKVGNRSVLLHWLDTQREKAEKAEKGAEKEALPEVRKLERDLVRRAMSGNEKAFYNLHFAQLCTQVSSTVQSLLEDGPDSDLVRVTTTPPAEPRSPRIPRATKEDARSFYLERSIDELQVQLRVYWTRQAYVTSLMVSGALTVLLWLYTRSLIEMIVSIPLHVTVAVAAGLLAPTLRRVVEDRFG